MPKVPLPAYLGDTRVTGARGVLEGGKWASRGLEKGYWGSEAVLAEGRCLLSVPIKSRSGGKREEGMRGGGDEKTKNLPDRPSLWAGERWALVSMLCDHRHKCPRLWMGDVNTQSDGSGGRRRSHQHSNNHSTQLTAEVSGL